MSIHAKNLGLEQLEREAAAGAPKDIPFAARLLPGLTDIAFLLPLLFTLQLGGLSSLLGDGDTGWHIRTGEWILRNRQVPAVDLFSYTRTGAPWFAWEWLWDLLFGWLHLHFGMTAVIVGSLLLICISFAMVYRFAAQASASPVVAMAVTVVGCVASSVHWLARPHLVTFVLTALFCRILEQARRGSPRRLWILPVLTILWANLHGGFFVGIALISLYAAGEGCLMLIEFERARRLAAARRLRAFALTVLACAGGSLVNPYGYHLHAHIYRYLTDKYLFVHISEFQALNFHHPAAPFYGAILMLGVMAALWHLERKRFTWSLLLVAWAWLALVATRNMPIYVICAAMPVSVALAEVLEKLSGARLAPWLTNSIQSFQGFARNISVVEAHWRLYPLSVCAFALLLILSFRSGPEGLLAAQHSPKRFPVRAVESLFANGSEGRVFTTDMWGGYLIYRLYPHLQVFVDGRSDFYGSQFGNEWTGMYRLQAGWEEQLSKFRVDTVLLPVDASLAGGLKESRNWQAVYEDNTSIVFRSRTNGNAEASAAGSGTGGRRDRAITKTITKTNL